MKGLRKVLRVSWTTQKTNEWVLNKAGVKKELLDTVKARKLQGGHPNPIPLTSWPGALPLDPPRPKNLFVSRRMSCYGQRTNCSKFVLPHWASRPTKLATKQAVILTVILWSHCEETRELRGERDNARNNARCTRASKATHGVDGQHQDVDRTPVWKSRSE